MKPISEMAFLSISRWQNRKERPNRIKNINGDMAETVPLELKLSVLVEFLNDSRELSFCGPCFL